jgi:hypothetical protein
MSPSDSPALPRAKRVWIATELDARGEVSVVAGAMLGDSL